MSKELIEKLKPGVGILNGVCTASLFNDLPCDWGAIIVGAAVQFYYREGGNYIDSEPNLNLSCNRSVNFRSNDSAMCVFRVHLACTVQIPGQPGPQLIESDNIAPDGQCSTLVEFHLSPKSTLPQSKIKSAGMFDRLEIIAK